MSTKANDKPFISFIIPTLCRKSLIRTLESLVAQTIQTWEAIVVMDTHLLNGGAQEINKEVSILGDERIRLVYPRPGTVNSAGTMRNEGFKYVRSITWIGFVDDDDVLTPQYVEHLAEHSVDHPRADMVIFRMQHPRLGILPDPDSPRLRLGEVGISFAIKVKSRGNVLFVREDKKIAFHEDWMFIQAMREMNKQVFISPHVDYIVRPTC